MTTPKAKFAGLALIAALCAGFTLGLTAPAWAGYVEGATAFKRSDYAVALREPECPKSMADAVDLPEELAAGPLATVGSGECEALGSGLGEIPESEFGHRCFSWWLLRECCGRSGNPARSGEETTE